MNLYIMYKVMRAYNLCNGGAACMKEVSLLYLSKVWEYLLKIS